MEDEQQLASLILLLRLPTLENDTNIIASDNEKQRKHESATSNPLQYALEKEDCKLLCFVGRLIYSYVESIPALLSAMKQLPTDEHETFLLAKCAFLRLAVRIAFLRYVSPSFTAATTTTTNNSNGESNDGNAQHNGVANEQRVWEWEKSLLSFLLQAMRIRSSSRLLISPTIRSSDDSHKYQSETTAMNNNSAIEDISMEEVDVEMAWVIQSLLLRLSSPSSSHNNETEKEVVAVPSHNKSKRIESPKVMSSLWTQSLEVLVTRRQSIPRGDGVQQQRLDKQHSHQSLDENNTSMTNNAINNGENNINPLYLMARTIHSILDNDKTSPSQPPTTTSAAAAAAATMHATTSQTQSNNNKHITNNTAWEHEYDIAVASCLQSCLQSYSDTTTGTGTTTINSIMGETTATPTTPATTSPVDQALNQEKEEYFPQWTHRTLLEMIRWSQQSSCCGAVTAKDGNHDAGGDDDGSGDDDANNDDDDDGLDGIHMLSMDIYWLTLQYLHQCCQRVVVQDQPPPSSLLQPSTNQGVQWTNFCSSTENGNDDHVVPNELFIHAIRSFLFYGLIVLCNDQHHHHHHHTSTTTSQFSKLENDLDSSNAASTADESLALQSSNGISQTRMREEIYSLLLELWQLFGPDWLYCPHRTPSSFASNNSGGGSGRYHENDWWWFSSKDDSKGQTNNNTSMNHDHDLGPAWPLCTLVRLAAGELRLGLGQWMACLEGSKKYESDNDNAMVPGDPIKAMYPNNAHLVDEIQSCARIVVQAVQLMTDLADDADGTIVQGEDLSRNEVAAWSPESILHIRQSLEDALNSSIQFFNFFSEDIMYWGKDWNKNTEAGNTGDNDNGVSKELGNRQKVYGLVGGLASDQFEQLGRTCCLVLGTIASELELDYLLAIPSDGSSKEHDFFYALRVAIQFCDSLSETIHSQEQQHDTHSGMIRSKYTSFEDHEPMSYLLSCILCLVSGANSGLEENKPTTFDDKLDTAMACVCKDGHLVLAITKFLYRTSTQWNILFDGKTHLSKDDDSSTYTIISHVRLCAVIIEELSTATTATATNAMTERRPAAAMTISKDHRRQLCRTLECWNKNLSNYIQWMQHSVPGTKGLIDSDIETALDQIAHCLMSLTVLDK